MAPSQNPDIWHRFASLLDAIHFYIFGISALIIAVLEERVKGSNSGSWDWIGISSGSSGCGNGTVNYFVTANNVSSTRTGTLTIAGKTFTITQNSTCNYSITPLNQTFSREGWTGSVSVKAEPGCNWKAETNSGSWDWIGINSGWSGTGNGTVNYFVLANNSGGNRTGTLKIAENVFTITQRSTSCDNSITPTSQNFNAGANTGSVSVLACQGQSWTASTNSGSWDWIGISSGLNGAGNGSVNYFVLANNTGQSRTGTLTISGKTFTVVQSGTGLDAPNCEACLANEDFEKYSANQTPPSPWFSLDVGGFPGTVTDQASHSGEKSLILSEGSYTSESAVVDIGDSFGDSLSYEAFIRLDSLNSGAFVGFFEEIGNQIPEFNSVYFDGWDGKIYFTSSDKYYPVNLLLAEGFEIGVWNKVHVDLDFQSLRGNVYVNSVLVGDSIPISPRNAAWGSNEFKLRKIGILRSSGDRVYLDDFSVR